MSAPRPPESTNAQGNITAAKGTPGSNPIVKGKSTKDIFKDLTMQQYFDKTAKLISRDDPLFASMVLLDVKAARLRNNNNHIMQNNAGNVSVGDVNTLLQTLGVSKETVSHQSSFEYSARPLINNANQVTIEKEGLENDIQTYITELHSKLRVVAKELEEGKPTSQIRNALAALNQAETTLTTRVTKLGANSEALQKQLIKIHSEMLNIMSLDAKKKFLSMSPEKAGPDTTQPE